MSNPELGLRHYDWQTRLPMAKENLINYLTSVSNLFLTLESTSNISSSHFDKIIEFYRKVGFVQPQSNKQSRSVWGSVTLTTF